MTTPLTRGWSSRSVWSAACSGWWRTVATWWAPDWKDPRPRFAAFVGAWMLLQVIVVFSYVWGRAQSPSAARLVIAIDTFFSFFAAWALTVSLRRWRPFVAVLIAAAVLAIHVPIASQHRMLNRLTQTQRDGHRLALLREPAREAHPDRHRSSRPLHHHGIRRDELRERQAGPLHLRCLRATPFLRHLRGAADQAVDGEPAARLRHLADAKARDDAGISERRGRVDSDLAPRDVERRYLP